MEPGTPDSSSPAAPIGVLLIAPAALRARLAGWLASEPRLQLRAATSDVVTALRWLGHGSADVVLLACADAGSKGLSCVRTLMETMPRPVVACAQAPAAADEAHWNRLAVEAGALAGVALPPADAPVDMPAVRRLLETVRLMAEVKVVRRWVRQHDGLARTRAGRLRLVGIGASTGGPPVLQTILSALPADFPLPVLVVQHIAPGFLAGLAGWLQTTSPLKVCIAEHAQVPQQGHVYLAPDGWQMAVDRLGRIALSAPSAAPSAGPLVASLFRSLADVSGAAAIGVLLTGMGKDGAAELRAMKERGAVTIAQDALSSVVHGMAGEAIALGGATHVLPPEQIAPTLAALARQPLPPQEFPP